MICVITQILLTEPKYTYPFQAKLLNLMLFYNGRDHTIIIVKDSSLLDVEIRHKHNYHACQYVLGEEQELKQRPWLYLRVVCPVLFKKETMPARQSGSPRQQCSGAISAFVDSIDSHIILRMIRESIKWAVYIEPILFA